MKYDYETYSKWLLKRMVQLIVVTFLVSCIMRIFVSEMSDITPFISILSIQSVLIVFFSAIMYSFYKSNVWNWLIIIFVIIFSYELNLLLSFSKTVLFLLVVVTMVLINNRLYYVCIKKNKIDFIKKIIGAICITGLVVDLYFIVKKDRTGELSYYFYDLVCYLVCATLCVILYGIQAWKKEEELTGEYSNCVYSIIVFRYIWYMFVALVWAFVCRVCIMYS